MARSVAKIAYSTGLSIVIGLLTANCGGGSDGGSCSVEKGDYIGPDTGYIWDSKDYCAGQSACESFCNSVSSRDDFRNCHFIGGSSCSGDLPTPSQTSVCAIALTVSCGGSSGSTTTNCYGCDTVTPNKSDYDPSTDCLSKWGSNVGRGATCDAAMSDLASQ